MTDGKVRSQSATSQYDANVFLIFAVVGSFSMWLMKWISMPQLIITTVMVAAVVFYAFSVYRFDRWKLRLDQAGDNAYYLGLIYTLLSMIFALVEIGNRVGEEATEGLSVAEAVIGDFGLALGTTLAGIVCRVFLHQMRSDPGNVEDATRIELALAAERMQAQIKDLTTSFGSFFVSLQQQQEDYTREVREMQESNRAEVDATISSARAQAEEQIRKSGETLSVATDRFQRLVDDCAESFTSVGQHWSQIEQASPSFSRALENLSKSASQSEEQLGRLATSAEEPASRLSSLSNEISATSNGLSSLILDASKSIKTNEDAHQLSSEKINSQVETLATSLNELSSIVSHLTSNASRSADAVLQSEEAAVKVLESLTVAVKKLN